MTAPDKPDYLAVVERLKGKREGEAEQWEAAERERKHRERLQLCKQWGIPERLLREIRNLRQTPAVQAVERWFGGPRESWCAVLAGPVGIGKSQAAAWWLWRETKDRRPAKNAEQAQIAWWTAAKLARVSSFDGSLEQATAGLLVIDDLGTEYLDGKGNFQARLDEILTERHGDYRRTVITTNLSKARFIGDYGGRVADRVRDAGELGGFLELTGASMRGKQC
jgi:hypothetical protein